MNVQASEMDAAAIARLLIGYGQRRALAGKNLTKRGGSDRKGAGAAAVLGSTSGYQALVAAPAIARSQ